MSFTGGGDVVGAAFVEVHAIPSPGLAAETAAIAERTALGIQAKLAPAVERAGKSINTAALGIVAGLALIGKKAVSSFSDTVEALNVTDVAFQRNAKNVKSWATGLSSSFGLTNKQILSTSSNFALLLENAEVGLDASTQLAKALTERAGDISSFFNLSGVQVIDKLTSGLVGETRAVRDLGIDVSETAVKQKALALGIKATSGELDQGTKVQIRAQLILEQSTKAMGDAIRTSGTFEGRLRTLRGEVGDLSDKIGGDLIPSLGLIGIGAEQAVKTLNEAPDIVRTIAVNVGFLGTAAVATAFAWEKLAPAVASVGRALSTTASVARLGGSLLLDLGAVSLLGPVGAVAGLIALGHATEAPIASIAQLNGMLGDSTALLEAFFAKAAREHGPGIFDTARDILFGAKDSVKETADEVRKQLDAVFAVDPALARRIVETAERAGDFYAGGLRTELDKLSPIVPPINIPVKVDLAALKEVTASIQALFRDADAVTAANAALANATTDVGRAQAALNVLLAAGPDKEIADQRDRLADSTQSVADALQRQADAQAALDALRVPASEQELADGADALTEAQIRLARALRARDEAEKALHPAIRTSLNLQGLSLDQLRSTLANARATLQAQRSAATTGADPATLAENATLAEIDVRKATEAVGKAQGDLLTLQQKGHVETTETEAAERTLERAKRDTVAAQKAQQTEEKALASLLAGNTQYAKDAAAAGETLAAAKDRQKSAEESVRDAVAKQADDTTTILGNQVGISNELRTQIGLHKDLFATDAALRRKLVENTLAGIGAAFVGPFLNGPPPLTPSQIDQIFGVLSADPSRLIALLDRLGLKVSGHELGGLITRPELAWIGEKFKPELVLPLSDQRRTWSLLAEHLPKFTRPEPPAPVAFPSSLRRSPGGDTGRPSDLPMNATQAERIIALLEELVSRPAGPTVDVGGVTVAPTPGMSESQLARKVQREMQRYWGNS